MFKLTAIVSLMLIATWSQADSKRQKKEATASRDYDSGSTWTASLSCESCGSECASACGTRHFRSCCFNYLRRKRGPDSATKLWLQNPHDQRDEQNSKPIFVVDNGEPWLSNAVSDFRPLTIEDPVENRLRIVYDA